MLSFINNNIFNFSALEQFEILTFFYPDLDNIWSFLVWTFIPREVLNNINLSLILVLFYLTSVTELKTKNYCSSNFSGSDNQRFVITSKELLVYSNNKKLIADLSLESLFILYNLINFVYTQILENLSYKKPLFLNYALTLFTFLLVCNVLGMIPYSLTVTSYIIITLNLSGMSFFANMLIGLRIYGW